MCVNQACPVAASPIGVRINWHWHQAGIRSYARLIRAVFPPGVHPRAWRTSARGGPPACARSFGAALRRLGYFWDTKGAVWRRDSGLDA